MAAGAEAIALVRALRMTCASVVLSEREGRSRCALAARRIQNSRAWPGRQVALAVGVFVGLAHHARACVGHDAANQERRHVELLPDREAFAHDDGDLGVEVGDGHRTRLPREPREVLNDLAARYARAKRPGGTPTAALNARVKCDWSANPHRAATTAGRLTCRQQPTRLRHTQVDLEGVRWQAHLLAKAPGELEAAQPRGTRELGERDWLVPVLRQIRQRPPDGGMLGPSAARAGLRAQVRPQPGQRVEHGASTVSPGGSPASARCARNSASCSVRSRNTTHRAARGAGPSVSSYSATSSGSM